MIRSDYQKYVLAIVAWCGMAGNAAENRPNIVLCMSDDMGFSDIGCYGGEVRTPTLDSLAANGVVFSQFYNTARCCPTRASLLTGLQPHQAGVGHMTHQHSTKDTRAAGPYQGWLNDRCVTIAEVLGSAGYRTYMAGKWHVGTLDKDTWPRKRGFDRYYGLINGASNFFRPKPDKHLTLDETVVEPEGDDYYTTDCFTNYAISFAEDHVQHTPDQPFFLYLAFTCPHWPLQAWPKDIARYRGRYLDGWDVMRQKRLERLKELNLLPDSAQLSERDPEVPAWKTLDEAKRQELDHIRAIYAAMIDRMDQNLARLVATLKRLDQFENTVFIFLNDNGACEEGKPLGSYKPELLGTKEGYGPPMYGNCWANASSAPFRMYKHWVHEGGIRSPLIVHWPAGLAPHRRGKIVRQYAYLPDIMSTCVELANANYPRQYHGRNILPMEGKSFLEAIKGSKNPVHSEPICWEHEGNRAVRLGRMKLVAKWNQPWELFDLDVDPTETHDLAAGQPQQVAQLAQAWDDWAKRCGVLTWEEARAAKKRKPVRPT